VEFEDQQEQVVKNFIKQYVPWIAAGLIIGLGGLFTWRSYTTGQDEQAQQRTQVYQQIVEQLQQSYSDEAAAQVRALNEEMSGTTQAALGRLTLARYAAQQGDFDEAAALLETAAGEVRDPGLKGIIATRLARVEIERGNYDAAEAALANTPATGFEALTAEIRGDIAFGRGQPESARDYYSQAVALSDEGPSPFLQMKLDNLAGTQ